MEEKKKKINKKSSMINIVKEIEENILRNSLMKKIPILKKENKSKELEKMILTLQKKCKCNWRKRLSLKKKIFNVNKLRKNSKKHVYFIE